MEQETNLQKWLSRPPKYTTFRINKLKNFHIEVIRNFLTAQKEELNCTQIPKFYLLRPDCLVIERWPEEVVVSASKHEVIVDAMCAAAVLRGAHVFAPGVMGLPTNCYVDDIVDVYGDLEGQCKRGLKIQYNGKKQYVGAGYLKMLRHDLFDNGVHPNGIAIHNLLPASKLPVINESIFSKGEVVLQNLPSIVCGWVVNAQPNEHILDMCAAPGNKTTHLGEMSNNQAHIIAIDKSPKKVAKIRENCNAHGITCVTEYAYDSTVCCSLENNTNNDVPPFQPNTFDKVLLDAPCSGLGRRPQLVNKMSPKILKSYKFLQRKLFDAAVKVLKVGGHLIYSTCTVTQDENERMIVWALDKYPIIKLVSAEPFYGGPGFANCGLTEEQRILVQRFGPDEDNLRPVEPICRDTIGFFIAKFIKVGI